MPGLNDILKMQREKMKNMTPIKDGIKKIKAIPQHIKDSIIPNIDIIHERRDICNSCEFLTKNHRCLECGCFMNFKIKLKQASCPIGKWDKVIDLPQ